MSTKHEKQLLEIFNNGLAQLDPVKPEEMINFGEQIDENNNKKNKKKIQKFDNSREAKYQEIPSNKQFYLNNQQPLAPSSTDDSSNNKQNDKVILENTNNNNNYEDFQGDEQDQMVQNQLEFSGEQFQKKKYKIKENDDEFDQNNSQNEELEVQQDNKKVNENNVISGQYSYNIQKQRMEQKIKKAQQKKKENELKKEQENQKIQITEKEQDFQQQQKQSKISKKDFKFDKNNKVINILMEEEEIGEVGEMIEKTANAKFQHNDSDDVDSEDQQKQQNEDDEFDQAFEEGKKGIIAPISTNRQIDNDEDFFDIETEASKARKQIQQKANEKLKGKTSQLGNRQGYMVNKLSTKAALIKINDQENLNSKRSVKNQKTQENQNVVLDLNNQILSPNNKKHLNEYKNQNEQGKQRKQNSIEEDENEDQKIVISSKLSTHQDDIDNDDDKNDDEDEENENEDQLENHKKKQTKSKYNNEQNNNDFDFNEDVVEEDKQELKDKVLSPQQMERLSNEKKIKNQQQISEDEWNIISKETLKLQEQKKSQQNKVTPIQFMDAWNQVRQLDLTQEMKQVYQEQQVKLTLFQKLFSFCSKARGHKLNKPSLLSEKDRILAFSKIKFDDQDALHFQMIFTIYTQLTSQDTCLRYGSHWEEIGFQGSDPATDIRGGGMFGILQILAFVSNHILYLREALQYSQHEKYNFPLSITLMNITTYVLVMLKEGKLDDLINSEKQVMSILNKIYFTTFFVFFDNYKSSKSTVESIGHLLKNVRENVQANPKKFLKIFKQKIDRFYKEKNF
ncbi:hypothetical protein PPERSA_08850 [Pseudocohnilembus persalinus]|uniref:ELMO domain-containing protein n=1 Tax=Pseudocohnilembus persalinus TaxID=266149 RepID=A0A0V0R3V1_PSEPJ|nr:hypothetical protein PPERSA_08850 [Pseudocohnilembus persalinus]|eukprot:KRX09134.1 hypothetical protein PPERSA_08850 [Pseudocohnilembus persalinus]